MKLTYANNLQRGDLCIVIKDLELKLGIFLKRGKGTFQFAYLTQDNYNRVNKNFMPWFFIIMDSDFGEKFAKMSITEIPQEQQEIYKKLIEIL